MGEKEIGRKEGGESWIRKETGKGRREVDEGGERSRREERREKLNKCYIGDGMA